MTYPRFKKFAMFDTDGSTQVAVASSADDEPPTETPSVTLGEKYFYVTDSILIAEAVCFDTRIDRLRRINGNFFISFDEAKSARDRIRKALRGGKR